MSFDPRPLLTRRALGVFALTAVASLFGGAAHAQSRNQLGDAVMAQIGSLLEEKEARTPVQAKLGSQLWYALQASRGQQIAGLDAVYDSAKQAVAADSAGMVSVDITATVGERLLQTLTKLGGQVIYASPANRAIRASMPLAAVETLAQQAAVTQIEPAHQATTNVGALTAQSYVSHKAREAIASGYDGTGVKIGVLSDSATAARVAALVATGDLPADTLVVPGQIGSGSDEGTAMMEIAHDIAPGAKLFFATAFTSAASFADNIRTLRDTYGCDIIVDDVNYFNEGAFQDGPIAQSVNAVTASGALYFSSAGNSGSITAGTSGTWEGDFVAGAASATPLPAGYTLHNFTGSQAYNLLLTSNNRVSLKWSDPLGASSNDYDLFVLDSTGATIICSSTTVQSGAQDPYEFCGSTSIVAGNRIVVAKKAAATNLALRVDTHRGTLSVATNGSTYGHNGGQKTVTTAAVYWNSGRTGTVPFVGGAANPTESFNSDGPRKIFFNPDGTPVTPGNLRFSTGGGITYSKPDIAAADGVSTKTPGFLPFFGTSAAAPTAAAIAALVKSARPTYTNTQILAAMKATTLDIRAVGVDQDSGSGLVMAKEAVDYALTH